MPIVKANGINIEVEEFGRKSDPTVLLIMGLAAQLTLWPKSFIDKLVEARLHVVRFDNRDIGLSEKLHSKRAPHPATAMTAIRLFGLKALAPYTLHDMAADSVGVLDALGVKSAHIVGVSMGGMIGQLIAADYADRVKSFTAIMSNTNNRRLKQADPRIMKELFGSQPRARSRDELIDRTIKIWDTIGSPNGGNDPIEFRQKVADSIDRCTYPTGVHRQIAAILATGDLRRWTQKIGAPSLVIHGSVDPLSPKEGGLDIAANIKNARAEIIDGMAHDLPPKFLPRITELVLGHIRAVEDGATKTRAA